MSLDQFFAPDLGAYVRYVLGFCVRYFAIAGTCVCFFHVWFKRRWLAYRIQESFPDAGEIAHEIRWSMLTALCTGLSTLLMWRLIRDGRTAMYFDIGAYGVPYFVASSFLCFAGYDTWFYWQHRLLHTRWLFEHAHAIHHRVANPTPFATFAHHPIETFMGNVYFILFVVLVPVHPLAIFLAGGAIFAVAIIGHLGYEFYPAGFVRHRVTRWVNTGTHHNIHHSDVGANFSMCFNLWDWLLGTNHRAYADRFDLVKARSTGRGTPRVAEVPHVPATAPVSATAVLPADVAGS